MSKDHSYRKAWYIENFIERENPDLAIVDTDGMTARDTKETIVRTISNQLNNYTKTAVSLLINKLSEMNIVEENRNWKNVPDHLKQKCYQDIELIAKKANLNLDRCIDSWGAKVLAANHYPNATRKSKVSLTFTLL